jgi:N-formylglutamate deformylase
VTLPVLVSIPHGGAGTPPGIAGIVRLTPADLFDDSDACTRDIYGVASEVARLESFDIGRAFVDLNRAPGDRPPANPDGVVKSATAYGVPVYREGREPNSDLVEALLDRYYRPYHERLAAAAATPGLRLALDCHSMAAVAPPAAPDAGSERPLFCLSNADGRTCPAETLERLARGLAAAFECPPSQVWLNRPFKGGYITRHHGAGPLPWVQLEMNRSLYLAEPWFDRERLAVAPERLAELRDRFLDALRRLEL